MATVERPLDLNLLRITPRALQVTADLATFQPVFWAKNIWPNYPYGPIIILRSEDKCLCPLALVKEYLARTKDREQRSEPFVTRKIGPAISISNATIVKWLKETLALGNIRASGTSNQIEKMPLPIQPARIIEQTSGSIQGVNVAVIATDNPL